jgi:uncharacterized protein YgbK (DUF1537 family)
MVVTGGDTLATILDQLAVGSLTVHREIEPGVVWCTLGERGQFNLVSKAGGFGSAEVFTKALDALSGGEPESGS